MFSKRKWDRCDGTDSQLLGNPPQTFVGLQKPVLCCCSPRASLRGHSRSPHWLEGNVYKNKRYPKRYPIIKPPAYAVWGTRTLPACLSATPSGVRNVTVVRSVVYVVHVMLACLCVFVSRVHSRKRSKIYTYRASTPSWRLLRAQSTKLHLES